MIYNFLVIPNPIKFVSKPEYFFHPVQVFRRLAHIGKPIPTQATIRLPWGAAIQVHTGENVGSDIYHYGIFDKIVPEAIWRLLDNGETAMDVGANIGQNTSVMAHRTGTAGLVYAFEPHPQTFLQLKANHALWKGRMTNGIQLENLGLGAKQADAFLYTDSPFLSGSALHDQASQTKKSFKVHVETLDIFVKGQIGVCKIDVEGHELKVLIGAEEALSRHAIRDIIFEDFQPKPSPVTEFLRLHGFTVFELHSTWLKPRLIPLVKNSAAKPGFSFNFLATLDSARAVNRFRLPGWRCLLNL